MGTEGSLLSQQDGTITSHVVFHPWVLFMLLWSLSLLRPVLVWGCVLPTSLPTWAGAKAVGRDCGEYLLMGTSGHAGPPLCPALPQGWTHCEPLGLGLSARTVGTRLATGHPSSEGSALRSISWSSLTVDQRSGRVWFPAHCLNFTVLL